MPAETYQLETFPTFKQVRTNQIFNPYSQRGNVGSALVRGSIPV
jgi:hypothetical protein